MSTADFTIGEGDQSPAIQATLTGDDGKPIPLAGCTVKFNMAATVNALPTVSASCAILDPDNAIVQYDWVGSDTSTPRAYVAEFEITLPSGRLVTCPNADKLIVLVTKAVG